MILDRRHRIAHALSILQDVLIEQRAAYDGLVNKESIRGIAMLNEIKCLEEAIRGVKGLV